MANQSASQGLSVGGPVTLATSLDIKLRITLPARNITLSEVQRFKRSFVAVHKKAMTIGTVEKGHVDLSEQSVTDKFVAYLEENLRS
jgi:protein KTI12